MRNIGCHAFREQFVIYAWQMAPHDSDDTARSLLPQGRNAAQYGVASRAIIVARSLSGRQSDA